MTKAELLHRFRYVILILPLASAVSFWVAVFLLHTTSTGELSLPSPIETGLNLFHRYGQFAVMGWLLLTMVCSALIAYMVVASPHAGLRGTLAVFLGFVITCALTCIYVLAALLIFTNSPWF